LYCWLLVFFLGQQSKHLHRNIQPAITIFLLATITGLIASIFFSTDTTTVILLIIATIISLLVVIAKPLPVYISLILALILGLVIGLDSAQDSLYGKDKVAAFIGSGISIYMLCLYATGLAEFFSKKHWQKTGIRILSSWIAASALLVLSLNFVSKNNTNKGLTVNHVNNYKISQYTSGSNTVKTGTR